VITLPQCVGWTHLCAIRDCSTTRPRTWLRSSSRAYSRPGPVGRIDAPDPYPDARGPASGFCAHRGSQGPGRTTRSWCATRSRTRSSSADRVGPASFVADLGHGRSREHLRLAGMGRYLLESVQRAITQQCRGSTCSSRQSSSCLIWWSTVVRLPRPAGALLHERSARDNTGAVASRRAAALCLAGRLRREAWLRWASLCAQSHWALSAQRSSCHAALAAGAHGWRVSVRLGITADRLQSRAGASLWNRRQRPRLLSRIIWARRISVTIGFGAVLISTLVAVGVGVTSGYFGGWLDLLVQRLVDIWISFPALVLLVSLVAILGRACGARLSSGIPACARTARVVRGPCCRCGPAVRRVSALCGGEAYAHRAQLRFTPMCPRRFLCWRRRSLAPRCSPIGR